MTLRIKLFGSLELERDSRPLARFASRKSGELLAYLALNRKAPHTREHLAGMFWGDSSEERARHTLNTTLWRINRVLEPAGAPAHERGYLRVTPQHIGFNAASGVWLDVAEFERRCELAEQTDAPDQRFALYSQAINLYRGDLLADCYEDWCIVERERLQGLYVRALARLMALNSSNTEYDLAIDCARRILSCDPLREEVHRDLMRLHLDAGQPAAALRQYRQCEDLLRDELGVEPAPETRALLAPILGATSTTNRAARKLGTTSANPALARPSRSAMPAAGASTLAAGSALAASSLAASPVRELAARIEHLSAACDAARAQLAEAMALLSEVTAEYESRTLSVAS